MPTGHAFIGVSLDGFIARRDGDIEWLTGFSSPGEDHGFDAHKAKVDGIIMGVDHSRLSKKSSRGSTKSRCWC